MKLFSLIVVSIITQLLPSVVSSFLAVAVVKSNSSNDHSHSRRSADIVRVSYQPSSQADDADDNAAASAAAAVVVPSFVETPVLRRVYPELVAWKAEYGNPNIPLGTPEGRQCKALRRLQIQQRLLLEEEALLRDMGFRFNDLEDVYFEADFDDMLARLVAHEEAHHTNYQVPKKYPQDPELGAWVTGLRRLGGEKSSSSVKPEHIDRLNAISFSWVSTRKCGSKFMQYYRTLVERVGQEGPNSTVLKDEETQKWIKAQREARLRGTLSDTRYHYLQELLGQDWMDLLSK